MKIIKVIVDELPDNCNGCKYYDRWLEYCHIVNKGYSDSHIRPDWCPLILEEDVESWLMTRPQKPKYILCDNEIEGWELEKWAKQSEK